MVRDGGGGDVAREEWVRIEFPGTGISCDGQLGRKNGEKEDVRRLDGVDKRLHWPLL